LKTGQYAPLIEFTLRGLSNCWMPEKKLFSFRYKTDDPGDPNHSEPTFDPFYTLNVLLGFSKLDGLDEFQGVPIASIFETACHELLKAPDKTYAFGMALWAGAELGIHPPEPLKDETRRILGDQAMWEQFAAQDTGMLLSGCVAFERKYPGDGWGDHAARLKDFLLERFSCDTSGLFYNNARGFRRNYASFATGTYLSLALFHYGEWKNDSACIDRALKCVSILVGHQGKQGEWPWFYHVPSSRVVDMYEVYSVHQDGMAPAFLHHAIAHGMQGAREALVRGFHWILGENQLGRSMLVEDSAMIMRSQVRKDEMVTRKRRAIRSIAYGFLGFSGKLLPSESVTVRPECRSYHLGWILWSFGNTDDFRELTHHPAFGGVKEENGHS